MNSEPKPQYPVQQLLFFLAQDADEATKSLVLSHVEGLAGMREWVIRAPEPVNQPGPPPTVGGFVEIYSARPPSLLPKDIDRRHLEEVQSIVESLIRLSYEHMLAFEFELDGEFVGAVEDGQIDRSLKEGLLGEWERHLNTKGE